MASLAPYHNTEDFAMSIPNKVIDALALGLPVLCPLEGEVQRLITSHGVGLCYGTAAGASLSECLVRLLEDRALRLELSTNASRLYREQFSFEMVYGGLVTHLEKLAQASKLAVRHG